jgi:hypothetical protein
MSKSKLQEQPTESQLDELIITGDKEKCLAFFADMSEAQRKALSARAMLWARTLNGYLYRSNPQYALFDKTVEEDTTLYKKMLEDGFPFPEQLKETSSEAIQIAVLATNNLSELKKAGQLGLPAPTLALSILINRKPSWLDKWCQYALKEAAATHWLTIYQLEKAGLCQIEHSSSYWTAMVCTLANQEKFCENLLAKNEELREMISDILTDSDTIRMLCEPEIVAQEIFRKQWNSTGNIWGARNTCTREGSNTWRQALVELTEKNLIDKQRIIDCSFTILAGVAEKEGKKTYDQPVSTAAFAIKLNEALTKNDTTKYAPNFTSLVAATHKDVATYAINILEALPDQSLDLNDICAALPPVFLNKSKGPAQAALALLNQLHKTYPANHLALGEVLISAFSHSSKDIHQKALKMLENNNSIEEQTLLEGLAQHIDCLTGMERTKATKLLEKLKSNTTQNQETDESNLAAEAPGTDNLNININLDALKERAARIDPELKKIARIDQALEKVSIGVRLDEPVDLECLDFPRLNPNKEVKTISNVDDLIYLFSKVWSGKSNALELEQLLDGVSRLCAIGPEALSEKGEALKQKAASLTHDYSSFNHTGPLTGLAHTWLGDAPQNGDDLYRRGYTFLSKRCQAITQRARKRQAAPLLAMPSHEDGWIAPQILIERMEAYQSLDFPPDKIDFIQALLRLAPDQREKFLPMAQSLEGEMGQALRYALGADMPATLDTPEYWVSAFRSRYPRGTSEELKAILPNCGPDGAVAASYNFDVKPIFHFNNDRYSLISPGLPNFLPVLSADPEFPRRQSAKEKNYLTREELESRETYLNRYAYFPTVLLHDHANSMFYANETLTWLHNRESLFALYAKRMLQNIDSVGTYWQINFDLLFDPDISVAENGRYFLALALSSKNNDLSRLALDALIAAVSECRMSANSFGQSMANLLPSGVITPIRWTRSLRELAKVSTLHGHFVWQCLSRMMIEAESTPNQQISFLEILTELQLEHHFTCSKELEESLSSITGNGKGAKLAKNILANSQKASRPSPGDYEAALQDLESRITRAERWQTWRKADNLAQSLQKTSMH